MTLRHACIAFILLIVCGTTSAQTRTTPQNAGNLRESAIRPDPALARKLAPPAVQAAGPDLVITQLDLVPSDIQQSNSTGAVFGNAKFIFTIKNQGTQPIPKGWIAFRAYLNGRLLVAGGPNDQIIIYSPGYSANDAWQLLQPGASTVVTWPGALGGVPAGAVVGKVEVRSIGQGTTTLDGGVVVQPVEGNTGNNTAQATLTVP